MPSAQQASIRRVFTLVMEILILVFPLILNHLVGVCLVTIGIGGLARVLWHVSGSRGTARAPVCPAG